MLDVHVLHGSWHAILNIKPLLDSSILLELLSNVTMVEESVTDVDGDLTPLTLNDIRALVKVPVIYTTWPANEHVPLISISELHDKLTTVKLFDKVRRTLLGTTVESEGLKLILMEMGYP